MIAPKIGAAGCTRMVYGGSEEWIIVGGTNSVTLVDYSGQFSSRGYSGGRGGGNQKPKVIRHDRNMNKKIKR